MDGPGFDLDIIELGTAENYTVYGSDNQGLTWSYFGIARGSTSYNLADFGLNKLNAIKLEGSYLGIRGGLTSGADIDGIIGYYVDFNYQDPNEIIVDPYYQDPNEIIVDPNIFSTMSGQIGWCFITSLR